MYTRRIVCILFTLLNLLLDLNLCESLSNSEKDYAHKLSADWLKDGYLNAQSLYNCSNIDVQKNQFVDPEFWGHFLHNPGHVCQLKMLTNLCNVDGNHSSLIPNSKLCTGSSIEWYDHHFELTRMKNRRKEFKMFEDKMLKQGGYNVCMRDDVLPMRSLSGKKRSCTIISIGSNNHWGFERGAYNYTDCDIHTYEPRVVDNWHPKHENFDIIQPIQT